MEFLLFALCAAVAVFVIVFFMQRNTIYGLLNDLNSANEINYEHLSTKRKMDDKIKAYESQLNILKKESDKKIVSLEDEVKDLTKKLEKSMLNDTPKDKKTGKFISTKKKTSAKK